MKVAIVNGHFGGAVSGGGGLRQAVELALGLRELGHEVTMVAHSYEPPRDFEDPAVLDLEVRGVVHGGTPPDRMPGIQRRHWLGMRAVAGLVPPDTDVINAHDTPALRAGALASRRLGIPLVWTRNDESIVEQALIPDETIAGALSPAGRLARLVLFASDIRDARHAAAVSVLDSRNVRMVRRAYRRDAAIVQSGPKSGFFDPPDRAAARERLGIPADRFVAFGFGILFPHRRFEDLIDAVALLGRDPDVHALILGSAARAPGYARALAERAERHGLAGRVELGGEVVPDETLRDAYAAADVFVFPNHRQTWGLAPLEALASGTPAIVSTGAGVHEVLEGRPGVHVVPAEDPRALADALRTVAAGPAPDVGATRDWIRSELSRARYAERMAELFESVRR